MSNKFCWQRQVWVGLLLLLGVGVVWAAGTRTVQAAVPHLGYGANVSAWDTARLTTMGFNWIKVFNPPDSDLPQNVLLRIDAYHDDLNDVEAFGDFVQQLAQNNGAYIEAYEIGNEVNLDASYGWAASPVAADYTMILCEAYNRIKLVDPTAIVVSAGLAPTGRVQGNWNGHAGHNGLYQDEREYLRELLDAGGGACFDALGYHPYGYSADFDAIPDVGSADPTQNCTNGFCFRGVEKIYTIMAQEYNLGQKQVWPTEFGWIVQPPDYCLTDPTWSGRLWQIVTPEKQATNLVGAYTYAEAHYPWMGAMFLFNLNFNENPGYPECEQMRYYGIQGRPAETALAAMPKYPAVLLPTLYVPVRELSFMLAAATQPLTLTTGLLVGNNGLLGGTVFTATVDSAAAVVPTLSPITGTLPPGASTFITGTIMNLARPLGIYTGTITLSANPGTANTPVNIPITVWVVAEVHPLFIPLTMKN